MTAGVRATARIGARDDGRGGTSLPVLEGDGPLALRRTRGVGSEARVMLVGAMSGPLGGDHFTVEAEAAAGARLHIGSAAATIALPGQAKGESRYDVRLKVADGGELRWLPEQLISANGVICTSPRGSSWRRAPGSSSGRSRYSVGRVRNPGGSAAVSLCGSRDGCCWTRSCPADRALPVAGTVPRSWQGIVRWGNCSSYDRSSQTYQCRRDSLASAPHSCRSPVPPCS